MAWWETVGNGIRKRRRSDERGDEPEDTERRRPSRWTDAAVALLLAAADALALAGVALFMFLVAMSHSEPPSDPSTSSPGVPFFELALVWVVPVALGVSSYVHARLRMPITSVVQGLFFASGAVLAFGQTKMLLSLA